VLRRTTGAIFTSFTVAGSEEGGRAKLFWKHYDGSPYPVADGDRESKVAVVGSVGSPKLLRDIQFFVREVERIKELVHPREGSQVGDGGSLLIRDIGEEFEGVKTYTIARTVDAVCDHGIVVNRLRQRLHEAGYATGKDQYRDLYVHLSNRITSLFEVKPDTATTSLYTAIGQLLIHSVGQAVRPALIFVAPEDLTSGARQKLRKLGISVLGYRWVGDEPEFVHLAKWKF
jgi:hypothetical protein